MTYIRVAWLHDLIDEPVTLYSELDADRFEVRKVEVFRDGSCGYASASECAGGTDLGDVAAPGIEELNRMGEFEAVEITPAEFESEWIRRRERARR